MKKLPFTQSQLLKQYQKSVGKLLDDCDWIDTIDDNKICWLISDICEKKGVNIDEKTLLTLYKSKVKDLKLTTSEWREQYGSWEVGVPKIIGLFYEILENNT